MQFPFFPLRFEFAAQDPLYFSPGKAGNTLRGALGTIFKRIACVPECLDTRACPTRESCIYARVFEPVATAAIPGPSGLADPPRPFVFRARHLDGRTVQPGQLFHFDLHVFSLEPAVLAYFVRAFAALAHEGLGSGRSKAELQRVLRIRLNGSAQPAADPVEPATLDLAPVVGAPRKIQIGRAHV